MQEKLSDWYAIYLMSAKSIAQNGFEQCTLNTGRRHAVKWAVEWIRSHKNGAVRIRAVGCGHRVIYSRGVGYKGREREMRFSERKTTSRF